MDYNGSLGFAQLVVTFPHPLHHAVKSCCWGTNIQGKEVENSPLCNFRGETKEPLLVTKWNEEFLHEKRVDGRKSGYFWTCLLQHVKSALWYSSELFTSENFMCLKENGYKEILGSEEQRVADARFLWFRCRWMDKAKSTLQWLCTLKAVCGSPHEPWGCLGTSGAWEWVPQLGFRGDVEQLTQPG